MGFSDHFFAEMGYPASHVNASTESGMTLDTTGLYTITLHRLAQSIKTIVEINRWATELSLPRPLIRYQASSNDYQQLLPDLYRHRTFRLTDFRRTEFSPQVLNQLSFKVEYWRPHGSSAEHSQRFILPMISSRPISVKPLAPVMPTPLSR